MRMILNRLLKASLCIALITGATPLAISSDAESWGPPVGSIAPEISAQDQDGVTRDLPALSGKRGLLLVLSRSADW